MSTPITNDNSRTTQPVIFDEDAGVVAKASYDWMDASHQAQMRETMRIVEQNSALGTCGKPVWSSTPERRDTLGPEWRDTLGPEWRGAPVQPHVPEAEKRYQQELLEALRMSRERWRLAQEMEEMQIYAATQLSLDRPRDKPP